MVMMEVLEVEAQDIQAQQVHLVREKQIKVLLVVKETVEAHSLAAAVEVLELLVKMVALVQQMEMVAMVSMFLY
tara:strand:+ start:264 stop:485 length:222 start_codon:yes stop_codon:yes gene_type:complete